MSAQKEAKKDVYVRSPNEEKTAVLTLKFLEEIRYFKPDGKPNKEWKVFYADTWGRACAAAHDAAVDAARKRDGGMMNFNSEWMRAWTCVKAVAHDMMFEAGFCAAEKAQETMSGDVRNDVVREATLFGTAMFVDDSSFKDKNRILDHVRRRIEVLEKGYVLACDVAGVLYVYAQKDMPLIKRKPEKAVAPISLRDYISSKRK